MTKTGSMEMTLSTRKDRVSENTATHGKNDYPSLITGNVAK